MPMNPSIPSSESPGASNTLGGPVSGVVPGSTQAGDVAFGGDARDCEPGMPHYRIDALLVSLRIDDLLLRPQPALGPRPTVILSYAQEGGGPSPGAEDFGLGPGWSLNWHSWIEDDPQRPGADVVRHCLGGGWVRYQAGFDAASGALLPDGRTRGSSRERLFLVSSDPPRYELRLPDGSRQVFESVQEGSPRRVHLTRVEDPQGRALRLAYGPDARLQALTDAADRVTRFEYDDPEHPEHLERLTGVTDPFGRSVRFDHDDLGRLSTVTDVVGLCSSFGYDPQGRVDAMTTPYGTTRFARGGQAPLGWIEATDPLGHTERVQFAQDMAGIPSRDPAFPDMSGFPGWFDNSWMNWRSAVFWDKVAHARYVGDFTRARIAQFLHDAGNHVASPILESTKDPLDHRVYYFYRSQPDGGKRTGASDLPWIVARVQPDGVTRIEQYECNDAGNVVRSVDPVGRQMHMLYADNGIDLQEVRRKTAEGWDCLARIEWDDRHLPLVVTGAAGDVTTLAWDGRGLLATVRDPLGALTRFEHDDMGRLVRVVDPQGLPRATFEYDAFDRIAVYTDEGGRALRLSYDTLDRITQVDHADGISTKLSWDRLDLASATDRLGRTTRYEHDAARNLVAVEGPDGRRVALRYDEAGRLVERTDPAGHITRWERDLQGRIVAEIAADGTRETLQWDAAGRLDRRTNAAGQTCVLGWTIDDMLARTLHAEGDAEPRLAASFAWDACYPRLLEASRGEVSTCFDYGAVGAAGALLPIAERTGAVCVSSRHDLAGQVIERQVAGAREAYGYDALGRLTETTHALGTFRLRYLGQTRLPMEQQRVEGGTSTRWDYLDAREDLRLRAVAYPQQEWTERLRSDAEARILARDDEHAGQQRSTDYDYDLADRLIAARNTDGHEATYEFDAADNLVGLHGDGADWTAEVGPTGALQSIDEAGTRRAFRHDDAGRLLDDGQRRYRWDAEDRLLEIQDQESGTTLGFAYDGLGQRTLHLLRDKDGAEPYRRFVWSDGPTPCAEVDDAGELLALYYPQGEWHRDGAARLYLRDHLGSIVAQTDAAGTIVGRHRTDPWGRTLEREGASSLLGFAGMVRIEAGERMEMLLTPARAYDPRSARWMSRDPLDGPLHGNGYCYVNGSPISNVDPYGLWAIGAPLPQGLVDFSAGFGDALSFGGTDWMRNQMGTNGAVNRCSAHYTAGEAAGVAVDTVLGGAVGWTAAGTKGAGKEFSHWIPNRMRGPRSKWNGNYVTPAQHYYHDPFRYPRGWRDLGAKYPAWLQQLDRIPDVYKGSAAGAVAGTFGMAMNECECPR